MSIEYTHHDATRLCIAHRKQFFFDDVVIESAQNLTKRVHSPQKHPDSPVIQCDQPWENLTYFTCSSWRVIRDPADGVFKCWYEDWQIAQDEHLRDRRVSMHDPRYFPSRYLYAQSEDGIAWEKPELDVREENGRRTNIVMGDKDFRSEFGSVHSGYVFLDPFETDDQHRYKMMFNHRRPEMGERDLRGTYALAASSDGIHWHRWGDTPDFGPWGASLGDVLTIAFDRDARSYILNTRHPYMGTAWSDPDAPTPAQFTRPYRPLDPLRNSKRRIFQARSADLVHWSEPQPIIVPDDELDNIDDSFYGMTQFDCGGTWVGFLDVFHATDNTMDVQLVYSRNGKDFRRVQPGKPWLSCGDENAWDRFMVNGYGGPVSSGDDLYVYHGGARNHHDWWFTGIREGLDVPEANDMSHVGYALGLSTMKADRFVGLAANHVREGILTTKPILSPGGTLLINATCAPGGSIRVAASDENNSVLKGFSKEVCKPFSDDSVGHPIVWEQSRELPQGWIKLHFFVRSAEIFTFQVKEGI